MSLVPDEPSAYEELPVGGGLDLGDVEVGEDFAFRRKLLEEELLQQVELSSGSVDRVQGALSRVCFDVVTTYQDRVGERRVIRRLEMTRLQKVFAELFFVTGDRVWSYRRACQLLGVREQEVGVRVVDLFQSEEVGRYLLHLENRYRGMTEEVLLREWEKVLRVRREIAYSSIADLFDFSGDRVCLRPAREIPRSALRAVKKLKLQRVLLASGEVRETVEVELESRVPHLEALEERYSRLPSVGGGLPSGLPGGLPGGLVVAGGGEVVLRRDPLAERQEFLRGLVERLRSRSAGDVG